MNRSISKISAALLIALVFGLTSGCESARHIRNAQNHFNQAARQENQLLAKSLAAYQAGADASGTSSALADYKMALSSVDRAIRENRAQLRQEKLLGTAYMIKAMSLWRISDLNGTPPDPLESPSAASAMENSVMSSAARQELMVLIPAIKRELSEGQPPITLGTRDRVMLIALPGLLDHDRGRLVATLNRADAFFASAYQVLGEAAGAAPADHPVKLYLVMAQLQTLNAWAYAIDRLGTQEGLPPGERRKLVKNTIHARVTESLCPIKNLAENSREIQNQITQFLYLTGIGWNDAVSPCN